MTEQELVEKACRGFLAAIDADVYVGDRNDLESVIIDGHVNIDACMRAALSVIREALIEPSEAQWNGLARDLIMWHDMGNKTPRALFDHLTMLRREIPDWLRNEPEMQALDHVPSKGTRAALIYRAMIAASPIGEK